MNAERDFSNVSPQAAITFRLQPDKMVYATFGGGFKAGGFNPASPVGSESYAEEHTWHFEGGLKTTWAAGRLSTNVAAFYIDWTDLQLNLPNPFVPAQFYIANVGDARSGGFEVEVTARPQSGLDFFGALGYTHGRFHDGSSSINGDISGNELPNTPDYTATLGTQLSHVLTPQRRCTDVPRSSSTAPSTMTIATPWGRMRIRSPIFGGRPWPVRVCGSVGEKRLRYPIHPDRLCISGLCAVRICWRERQAPNLRDQRRIDVLSAGRRIAIGKDST